MHAELCAEVGYPESVSQAEMQCNALQAQSTRQFAASTTQAVQKGDKVR